MRHSAVRHFLQADLYEAAGAADASRATLCTSCSTETFCMANFTFAFFRQLLRNLYLTGTNRCNSPSPRSCRKRQRLLSKARRAPCLIHIFLGYALPIHH
jgi:hypothetical protein